jgi:membrane fusion protein, heavy metal efflux system
LVLPDIARSCRSLSTNVADRSDASAPELSAQSIKLSEKQIAAIKVAPVGYRDFQIEKTATGSIDFNQDMSVQVFTPYQGRIIALFAKIGDAVKKGDTLFTIDSPDLLQAESTLARNAAPGLFVQPGTAPAPFSVADISTMWLNAFVVESEIPSIALGQEVEAKVLAYPDRIFEGKVTTVGAAVDPATRRLFVRSEIKDPEHLLRPGMFARFLIHTGTSIHSPTVNSRDARSG